ncbi:hypothetical protein QFZ49_003264 [Streptomyces turgidiscabies]|uniref:Uncharacterized protein n=1 Tax=Streptomyces turgidiscabies TaxID=85558 RepID=A0ABU0RMV3_9ACTN|nr:hypothetical protein [Streptomyces turgidiscabies]
MISTGSPVSAASANAAASPKAGGVLPTASAGLVTAGSAPRTTAVPSSTPSVRAARSRRNQGLVIPLSPPGLSPEPAMNFDVAMPYCSGERNVWDALDQIKGISRVSHPTGRFLPVGQALGELQNHDQRQHRRRHPGGTTDPEGGSERLVGEDLGVPRCISETRDDEGALVRIDGAFRTQPPVTQPHHNRSRASGRPNGDTDGARLSRCHNHHSPCEPPISRLAESRFARSATTRPPRQSAQPEEE